MEKLIEFFIQHWVAIGGSIISAIFAAYLGWLNNFKIRRANACAAFRPAILNELGGIYPMTSTWPENIDGFLRACFTALQTAVENFRPIVPWWKRWLFDRAWFRYRCATGRKIDVQCYHHYMPFTGVSVVIGKRIEEDTSKTYKQKFKHNVDQLLKFANKK